MDVLMIMGLGVLAGRFLITKPYKEKGNEIISLTCTFLLIFSMGVTLGRNDNFLKDLSSLGLSSLLFFLVPTVLSILIVFILTKKLMIKKTTKQEKEVEE